jgi:3-oxoadipate enol-lactonase/4-carboxymuconolactone decarboxylase
MFPDRVDRLVLACTAPRLEPAEAWSSRAAEVRRAGTAGQLEGHLSRWLTRGFTSARPDVVRRVADMLDATDREGYAGCCEAIGSMDQRDAIGSIKAPTLVLAGADDPVVPPSLAVDVQSRVAGSSLVVLAGAAHLANVEQPTRFADAALDHLLGSPYERGQAVRRTVLGDDHVDRTTSRSTSFTAAFQDLISRYAWGEIWTRPGLDRATRSAVTLTALVCQGRFDELPMHVRGALRNGLSREEIGEVLLQAAVYCGVPAANTAFAVTQRTFDEADDG